jgi:hypothetical protein
MTHHMWVCMCAAFLLQQKNYVYRSSRFSSDINNIVRGMKRRGKTENPVNTMNCRLFGLSFFLACLPSIKTKCWETRKKLLNFHRPHVPLVAGVHTCVLPSEFYMWISSNTSFNELRSIEITMRPNQIN